jgi:hypothetical protein
MHEGCIRSQAKGVPFGVAVLKCLGHADIKTKWDLVEAQDLLTRQEIYG